MEHSRIKVIYWSDFAISLKHLECKHVIATSSVDQWEIESSLTSQVGNLGPLQINKTAFKCDNHFLIPFSTVPVLICILVPRSGLACRNGMQHAWFLQSKHAYYRHIMWLQLTSTHPTDDRLLLDWTWILDSDPSVLSTCVRTLHPVVINAVSIPVSLVSTLGPPQHFNNYLGGSGIFLYIPQCFSIIHMQATSHEYSYHCMHASVMWQFWVSIVHT